MSGFVVPEGMSEEEVTAAIDITAKRLAARFRFGYHGIDDMQQQARLFAVQVLADGKYDPSKGKLETFLYSCVRNLLFNMKRDNFERPDKPCLKCPLMAYDPHCAKSTNQCTEFDDKTDCEPYRNWANRNSQKKNVMCPIYIHSGQVQDEHEPNMKDHDDIESKIDHSTVVSIIEEHIPMALRADWIKLQNGLRLPKLDRLKLLETIRNILSENGIDGIEAWQS